MQDLDDEIPEVNDYSKEKYDSSTTPNLPSLLSPNNKDVGARSFTQAATFEGKLGGTAAFVTRV